MIATAPSKMTASTPPATVRVEFMPGRVMELAAFEAASVPKFVVAKLVKQGNGTFALIPQQWSQQVRLTKQLCREMGIQCDRKIIYNLIRAGLVKGTMISPRNTMVDLVSLVEHIQSCQMGAGKPVFWTKARIERYRFASIGAAEECDDDDFKLE
jgi:hypothetical protein